MNMIVVAAWLLFLSTLTGCPAVFAAPKIQLHQITVSGIDAAGLDLEVDLLVSNPNRFDLTLTGYSYTLRVDDLPLYSGGAQQVAAFPARHETIVRIPTRVRHNDLLALLKRQPDSGRIPYHLVAALQVDTPVGETSIPVDFHNQFTIPENYRPNTIIKQLKGLFSPP